MLLIMFVVVVNSKNNFDIRCKILIVIVNTISNHIMFIITVNIKVNPLFIRIF